MELYFIRHAQSTNNHLAEQTGADLGRSEDPELTELGWKQAARLGEFLRSGNPRGGCGLNGSGGFPLTHIYTSLMVRAVVTASIASEALDLPLLGWTCLHECGGIYLDNGRGERVGRPGKARPYFAERFPKLTLPEEALDTGWWNQPFEEKHLRRPRARKFLDDLSANHGGTEDRVAVVSHAGFYNEVMQEMLGRSGGENIWFVLNNTGITRVDFRPNETALIYQNRLDHLAPELVS